MNKPRASWSVAGHTDALCPRTERTTPGDKNNPWHAFWVYLNENNEANPTVKGSQIYIHENGIEWASMGCIHHPNGRTILCWPHSFSEGSAVTPFAPSLFLSFSSLLQTLREITSNTFFSGASPSQVVVASKSVRRLEWPSHNLFYDG